MNDMEIENDMQRIRDVEAEYYEWRCKQLKEKLGRSPTQEEIDKDEELQRLSEEAQLKELLYL